jgi:hypothetical protein
MEIREKFIEMVSNWDTLHKMYLLSEYSDVDVFSDSISMDKLDEVCVDILMKNLNSEDIQKILNIK